MLRLHGNMSYMSSSVSASYWVRFSNRVLLLWLRAICPPPEKVDVSTSVEIPTPTPSPELTPFAEAVPESVITDTPENRVAEPAGATESTDAVIEPSLTTPTQTNYFVPLAVTASILIESNKLRTGKDVKASLVLQAITPTQGLNMVVTLPKGVDYVDGSSKTASYDAATRQLTWGNLKPTPKSPLKKPFALL